jgi:dihydrofolate synthase / folylpolyglutamate synthase
MKFGLENMSRLSADLGHPERRFQSVIVAGTNGKGSVTAMVHQALVAAGHRAARYTSPHLTRIEERFVIGDREVAGHELEGAAALVRRSAESLQAAGVLDAPPTFFECATAIAFVLFREARVEVAVVEVGLGGRLDATNIVQPVAAAITSIDFDHQAQLGSTLESIAYEKAGVIKRGIPVVCGDLPHEAERVVRRVCDEQSARFVRASGCGIDAALNRTTRLALSGEHQRANAAVAVCLMRQLDALGIHVTDPAVDSGLRDVQWPGRLERLEYQGTEFLLDAAHNPAGARALAAYLRDAGWNGATMVFGAMKDKDVPAMLGELAPVSRAIVCTTAPSPRGLPAVALAKIARSIPGASWSVSAVPDPVDAARAAAAANRRVVVAGSIFVIGPLRGILRAP